MDEAEALRTLQISSLKYIPSERGRAYVTLHDERTIDLLENDPVYKSHWLGEHLRADPLYQNNKDTFGMLVMGRDTNCQVFYRRENVTRTVAPSFKVVGVHPQVHGYQTAYVLAPQ